VRSPRRGSVTAAAGTSLAEVLVALNVLTVAIVIALAFHDAARKSFKNGENALEQQQATRTAFDRLSADLRMAGYNCNPDGDTGRPDEPIEGAFDTAVVIRADFDGSDPAAAVTPEAALATGGRFSTVTTGNDEIVTYVLAKPDGSSGGTLTFDADLGDPRMGVVQRVTVPRVALAQDDPPYTLYRITLSNGDGSPVRTPLVDNVASLTFAYASHDGVTVTSPEGAESPEAREARARIRQITIDLVGLTREPDAGWADPGDARPGTRSYRKFRLVGEVVPRNLGMKGAPDFVPEGLPPSTLARPAGPSRGGETGAGGSPRGGAGRHP
jgi:hypothetical protein